MSALLHLQEDVSTRFAGQLADGSDLVAEVLQCAQRARADVDQHGKQREAEAFLSTLEVNQPGWVDATFAVGDEDDVAALVACLLQTFERCAERFLEIGAATGE